MDIVIASVILLVCLLTFKKLFCNHFFICVEEYPTNDVYTHGFKRVHACSKCKKIKITTGWYIIHSEGIINERYK